MGFKFDRSGYRVPAILVSPWVESGAVYNDEYRHTSLIATLRKKWGLGDPLTQRDAFARTFDHLFTRETPRNPDTWTSVEARPVPEWAMDFNLVNNALSGLGKTIGPGFIAQAKAMGVENLPPELDDPNAEITPELIIKVFRDLAWHLFPRLAPEGEAH
jgi:phospholipase C